MKFAKIKAQYTRIKESPELSFSYLQAELTRIDVMIRRAVSHVLQIEQTGESSFQGLYLTPGKIGSIAARGFGINRITSSVLPEDEVQALNQAYECASAEVNAITEKARQQGVALRLQQVTDAFGLSNFDRDALLVCIAPALDLHYEQLYGYLQDDVTRKSASVNLVLDLLCGSSPERLLMMERFANDAPLLRHGLLQPFGESQGTNSLLGQMLCVDKTVVSWLLGRYQASDELGSHAAYSVPQPSPADKLILTELLPRIGIAVGPDALTVLYGPDVLGQHAAARFLAEQQGRALLTIDLAGLIGGEVNPTHIVKLALRDALLTGAVLYLTGWQVLLNGDAPAPQLFSKVCDHPDRVIISSQTLWQSRQIDRERSIQWVEIGMPAFAQRAALWQHYITASKFSANQSLDLQALAGQFVLTSMQIRDAVMAAVDLARQNATALTDSILFAAARTQSSPGLGNLARKLTPRYSWHDIVLPQDQLEMLQELVKQVRERPLVLEQWGLGRKLAASNGITVLFAGPPGTGKTMSAEVIAAELGLDLYKIDLSTIVSKYIGETEKNLDRIFNEAESSNAILFFDEADAIFGKRSEVKDAHDRYANIEVSYLLQRMEGYNGVTILATNLRANLDEAFTRRLQFAIDFPFPDELYRLKIWQTLFPPEVPVDKSVDFTLMAKRFRIAGGNIRNIIVSAAFLAASNGGVVTMAHLLHGTRRELQKMGRLLNEKDLRQD